ncbi:MAG TPA: 2-C-methyl-D-erythritol 2,4-cyclodiphosphate synthase [Spirochaetota bacterium]|nr:2-C-methyl-D-erythritol 2,4-cyclodiphosphate synthase [Spirochaetota bacterium]HPQ49988.1 2-C-methyl-D-erythritol 2,4-cyclodiphosphate synthase [Spirochaetota bacterium]
MYRIGQGFDFHKFGDGNFIVLGGIKIDFNRGVIAYSDGDVIIHSIIDSLLGAIGFNDIGLLFPDTDKSLKGIDSTIMLKKVMEIVYKKGFNIVNVDITFLAENPRIKDFRDKIINKLASLLRIEKSRIGLKATTTEKMGAIGREEGIAASSVVLLKEESVNNEQCKKTLFEEIGNKDNVLIYTDGSCIGNPGPGGWSFIIVKDNKEIFSLSDGEKTTTNNKMEIKAVLEALKYLKDTDYKTVTIFTDSQYVSNALNSWLIEWNKNGWKTTGKKDVANKELWVQVYNLLNEMRDRVINFKWIKSHNGDIFNEKCDSMAREVAVKYSENKLF